jgi:hypothetical protein
MRLSHADCVQDRFEVSNFLVRQMRGPLFVFFDTKQSVHSLPHAHPRLVFVAKHNANGVPGIRVITNKTTIGIENLTI